MKQTLIMLAGIIIAAGIIRCSKKDSGAIKNTATCTVCNGALLQHTPDSTGLYYYLPTAFTPNGDGKNDVLVMRFSNKVNADSSLLTIWDKNGNGVFEGPINQVWNGHDLKGNLLPAGHYPLYLRIRTTAGVRIDTCGCVTILAYKGNCIYTGGITYYLPDQLDTTGFIYPTQDNLCH